MSENGEIYTAGKNFTLPLALTAWTNSTSDYLSHAWLSVYGTQCNFNCISPLVHFNQGLWDNHHQDVESCD